MKNITLKGQEAGPLEVAASTTTLPLLRGLRGAVAASALVALGGCSTLADMADIYGKPFVYEVGTTNGETSEGIAKDVSSGNKAGNKAGNGWEDTYDTEFKGIIKDGELSTFSTGLIMTYNNELVNSGTFHLTGNAECTFRDNFEQFTKTTPFDFYTEGYRGDREGRAVVVCITDDPNKTVTVTFKKQDQ